MSHQQPERESPEENRRWVVEHNGFEAPPGKRSDWHRGRRISQGRGGRGFAVSVGGTQAVRSFDMLGVGDMTGGEFGMPESRAGILRVHEFV